MTTIGSLLSTDPSTLVENDSDVDIDDHMFILLETTDRCGGVDILNYFNQASLLLSTSSIAQSLVSHTIVRPLPYIHILALASSKARTQHPAPGASHA